MVLNDAQEHRKWAVLLHHSGIKVASLSNDWDSDDGTASC